MTGTARSRAPRRWWPAVPGCLLAVALSACDHAPQQTACTLIGCLNGVRIEVVGSLPEGSRITLTPTDPDGLARSVSCTAESSCEPPILVADFTPASFTVRVTGEGIDFEETFTPAYAVSRPNGPGCPPECRNATITVDLR